MWTRPRRVCNLGLSWGAQRALGSIYTSLHVAHVRRWVSRSCSKAREDLGSLRAQCTVGAEAGECASGDRLRGRGSSQSQTQMRIRLVTNGRSGPRPHARPALSHLAAPASPRPLRRLLSSMSLAPPPAARFPRQARRPSTWPRCRVRRPTSRTRLRVVSAPIDRADCPAGSRAVPATDECPRRTADAHLHENPHPTLVHPSSNARPQRHMPITLCPASSGGRAASVGEAGATADAYLSRTSGHRPLTMIPPTRRSALRGGHRHSRA